MTDHELIAKLVVGDGSAADALYTKHKEFVVNVIYSISKGRAPSEELLQDTFTKAFLKAKQYDASLGEFRSWLGAIARNVTLSYLRRHPTNAPAKEAVDFTKIVDHAGLEQLVEMPAKELATQLRNALERLESPTREILHMRLVDQKPFDQIAKVLRMPTNTVKTIFYRRSRALLKKLDLLRIERRDDDGH